MGRRVFVGNLSWEAAWQDLKDHMRGPNGDLSVLRAEVLMDGSGRSKGCGIVEYSSAQVLLVFDLCICSIEKITNIIMSILILS